MASKFYVIDVYTEHVVDECETYEDAVKSMEEEQENGLFIYKIIEAKDEQDLRYKMIQEK